MERMRQRQPVKGPPQMSGGPQYDGFGNVFGGTPGPMAGFGQGGMNPQFMDMIRAQMAQRQPGIGQQIRDMPYQAPQSGGYLDRMNDSPYSRWQQNVSRLSGLRSR